MITISNTEKQITKDNVLERLFGTLTRMKEEYTAKDLMICEFNDILGPFLYYLKGETLTDEECEIGDLIKKAIFNAIYSCWSESINNFAIGVLLSMNGCLNRYSNGDWNDSILRNALWGPEPERIRLLALFVEYAGYKTDVDI